MINGLLLVALLGILAVAALDARLLHRLHQRCRGLENGRKTDAGLLRWYVQGFEHPLRVTRWLVRISAVIAVAACLAKAHPLMIAASVVVLSLSYLELRFGGTREREHQRAAAGLSARTQHR